MRFLAKLGQWLEQRFDDPSAQRTASDDFDASEIEKLNWRQGSVLADVTIDDLVRRRILPQRPEPGCWVVLTQDCDLVHHDLVAEPDAEVVFARHVDKPNKGYTWSKNARELHLRDASLDQSLAFQSRHRRLLPRHELSRFAPLPQGLHPDSVKLLSRWVSRKYFRAAFPDAFNDRLRPKENKIKKLLQKSPGHFQEIHINLTADELLSSQDYNIIVLCIAADESAEKHEDYKATEQLGKDFRGLLEKCKGINVVECEVRYRSDISLEDLDPFQRWDFDSITIRQTDTADDAPIDR